MRHNPHIQSLCFPCPYAKCRRWFKSRHGLTYHKRAVHSPSEPLVLAETTSELEWDQSISLLRDQGSDNSESDLELNPNLNGLGDIFSNLWAVGESNDPGHGGCSLDPPHPQVGQLLDADLYALGGDNLSMPGTGDRDSNSPTRPGTGLYREYHPYLTGEYSHI